MNIDLLIIPEQLNSPSIAANDQIDAIPQYYHAKLCQIPIVWPVLLRKSWYLGWIRIKGFPSALVRVSRTNSRHLLLPTVRLSLDYFT